MTTEQKRRPALLDHGGSFICTMAKRPKTEVCLSAKEKKDKVGERVSALQQLVSPFGKTDTASVLFEALEYINFLHDQVKALSAPYLLTTPIGEMTESEQSSLKSRGLCLVPVSCTLGVARGNGADIWTPTKSRSTTF